MQLHREFTAPINRMGTNDVQCTLLGGVFWRYLKGSPAQKSSVRQGELHQCGRVIRGGVGGGGGGGGGGSSLVQAWMHA